MGYYANLSLRVILAFLLHPNVYYSVITPLTMVVSYFVLSLFGYGMTLDFSNNVLVVEGTFLNFVEACSAGVAYFLLGLLILLTKGIRWGLRLKMFLIGCLMIFLVNMIRVVVLIYLLVSKGSYYFDAVHLFFWRVVASVLVVGIWIFLVERYKVKGIPIISDVKELYKRSYFSKD